MNKFISVWLFLFMVLIARGQTNPSLTAIYDQLTQRGEVYISIPISEVVSNKHVFSKLDFDKISDDRVYFYSNTTGVESIDLTAFQFQLESIPSMQVVPEMYKTTAGISQTWDAFPTYDQYDSLMHHFATAYPNLCEFHSLGTLFSGREILALKLGDNVKTNENEVQFFYTSTMHGDETTGYILLLRMIDYLLTNYGQNAQVTYLMDNVEIWINPLANPDGTYYGGNNTIYGATRYNANSVDINRNFPDAGGSLHPDGKVHQPETVIFMDFADSMNFTMSANFHGGAEVVNYPWDTWVRLHADDAWWQTVSYRFADTTHNYSPSTYLDMYGSGVTNGYAWYHVDGSRQDYMNFYANCREVTLEISDQKTIPASQLNAHWNYLYRSMLNYMEQSTYGFQGQVTDSLTGFAVKAKLELIGHDMDNSFVYTNDSGFFFRPVASGYYDLQFSAPHYYSKTLNQVYVDMDSIVKLDVQLVRDYTAITISTGEPEIHIFPNPVSNRVIIKSNRTFDRVEVYDVNSKVVLSQSFNQTTDLSLKVDDLETGFYFMVIHHSHWISMRKLIIQH